MKLHGQHLLWQRILALISVLAVILGSAPHEPGNRNSQSSLAPTPLPELRAAHTLPPLVPAETSEPPLPLPGVVSAVPVPCTGAVRAADEHAPSPRVQSGVRQLSDG